MNKDQNSSDFHKRVYDAWKFFIKLSILEDILLCL